MSDQEAKGVKNAAVLDVQDLTITYSTEKGQLDTVRGINLKIAAGEIYGLVGESGSGKTTLARAVVGYLPDNGYVRGGSIKLNGSELINLPRVEMRKIWGARIAMVHQDPGSAINPSLTVGTQIAEVAREHLKMSKKSAWAKAIEMLNKVRMPDPEAVARRYMHQLSGGMLQRVLIATALLTNPELLIMDEPTTALDVTTEAVILDLIRDILTEYNTAILYITHNLGVVARICDRVGVIYAGELMEEGSISRVFKNTAHPYTRGLLGCVPSIDESKSEVCLNVIPGYIPRPDMLPKGCIFMPRCSYANTACEEAGTHWSEVERGHMTACIRWKDFNSEPTATDVGSKKVVERVEGASVLLEARNIKKHFPASGVFGKGASAVVRAVDDMSVSVPSGLTLGIVGESGSGKTTFARCIVGLEEATDGEIELEGKRLPRLAAKRSRKLLKKIQMVFQNPNASLNPQYPVGQSVARSLELLANLSGTEKKQRLLELFRAVNLPDDYIYRLPHEMSGGEMQRVAIARALAADPVLLICDEPISSLDVSVQASLMNLLVDIQHSRRVSYLFISHDLAAVRYVSDLIAVVYLGLIWEVGLAKDVFSMPCHPYTEALLSAIPIADPDDKQKRIRLTGNVPSAMNIPSGCRFHNRCPRKIGAICEKKEPPWQIVDENHQIRCHIPLEELRKLQSSDSTRQVCAKGEEAIG